MKGALYKLALAVPVLGALYSCSPEQVAKIREDGNCFKYTVAVESDRTFQEFSLDCACDGTYDVSAVQDIETGEEKITTGPDLEISCGPDVVQATQNGTEGLEKAVTERIE